MKYLKVISVILFLNFVHLHSASIEIKLVPFETNIICSMPLWFEAEVQNISNKPVEIPKVENEFIGENGLCKILIIKSDGTDVGSHEYSRSFITGRRRPIPLQTEVLQPGETRKTIFSYGYPLTKMELNVSVECDLYENVDDYLKHFKMLDHQILSGTFKSNSVRVNIREPQGVDFSVYERYLKGKRLGLASLKGQRKEFLEVLLNYPTSKYSEYIAVEYFVPASFKGILTPRIDAVEKCKSSQKRESEVLKDSSGNKKNIEARRKKKKEIDALEKTVLAHPDSRFVIPLTYVLALKCLEYGDYTKSRRYWNNIKISKSNTEQDRYLIQVSRIFLKQMDKEDLI